MENTTQNTNKRIRIGFKYWNNEAENFIEEMPVLEEVQQISNNASVQGNEVKLSQPHLEVLERLEMVEAIILGKKFTTLTKAKKEEFLQEQNFLKQVHNQLISSY